MTTALARNSDPHTSHTAAEALSTQKVLMAAIAEPLTIRPMTDHRLTLEYMDRREAKGWPNVPGESIRKRRADLLNAGHISALGGSDDTASGRMALVWGYRA